MGRKKNPEPAQPAASPAEVATATRDAALSLAVLDRVSNPEAMAETNAQPGRIENPPPVAKGNPPPPPMAFDPDPQPLGFGPDLSNVDPDDLETIRAANEGVDMFAPGAGLRIKLPNSRKRAFILKAEVFNVKSRLGEGPCSVLKTFSLPNGDMARPGDTFDPVQERMSAGRYASLLRRKYFTPAGETVETKLLQADAKK